MHTNSSGRARRTAMGVMMIGAALSLGATAHNAHDAGFVQQNLVSDLPGLAVLTDPSLKNPWGFSHSSTSPFWTSNQGTDTSTLYAVTNATQVSKVALTVALPATGAGSQGPTGQVFNGNATSFLVGNGGDGQQALFIFADLNGTISAWNSGEGTEAITQVTTPGAVYTGLAINGADTQLYAANNSAGTIDVFNSAFVPVTLPRGAFVDPRLPWGLVPFNVQDINGDVYVTYAPPGRPRQISAPSGAGAVAVFDENGRFIRQLVAGGRLAAPWGIALAPPSFGRFRYDLLIGNFSFMHSEINAFDPRTGEWLGSIPIDTGGLPAGGLWAIGFGTGGSNGSPDVLYFLDGINSEIDGLFGAIYPSEGP